jgi:Rad3-related DNA helicase
MSALIDAHGGKDLVIEGPTGTGKSQTITNLIAASLAAGKSFLFVSEKLAALEVVKERLSNAGLADFCLELHSNKLNKLALLESLSQRLKLNVSPVQNMEQRAKSWNRGTRSLVKRYRKF